jgi:hypothetical protein
MVRHGSKPSVKDVGYRYIGLPSKEPSASPGPEKNPQSKNCYWSVRRRVRYGERNVTVIVRRHGDKYRTSQVFWREKRIQTSNYPKSDHWLPAPLFVRGTKGSKPSWNAAYDCSLKAASLTRNMRRAGPDFLRLCFLPLPLLRRPDDMLSPTAEPLLTAHFVGVVLATMCAFNPPFCPFF